MPSAVGLAVGLLGPVLVAVVLVAVVLVAVVLVAGVLVAPVREAVLLRREVHREGGLVDVEEEQL
ncbi:hypothetical protein, partial [Bacillus cereus group sp. N8]|uniref:hypothetical protein n=1 Tax=Bacillus cereus group sp. N8 TaxID=2794584 RepID=UPI001A7EDCDD